MSIVHNTMYRSFKKTEPTRFYFFQTSRNLSHSKIYSACLWNIIWPMTPDAIYKNACIDLFCKGSIFWFLETDSRPATFKFLFGFPFSEKIYCQHKDLWRISQAPSICDYLNRWLQTTSFDLSMFFWKRKCWPINYI